jgi:endonuclease/exonuclease/phosphatase family metal-dependent hydrolase
LTTHHNDLFIDHQYLVSPEDAGGQTLTVLSANLRNPFARFFPGSREALLARLEAFAQLAESARADILLCQEVGRSRNFRVDNWIAHRLQMGYCYVRANGDARRIGREEGLAIFSRHPLRQPTTHLLAGGLWRRPALGVVAATPLGEVAVYTAHLSLRPWRNRRQPARLRAWVEATAGERPAVLGGDFNAHETAPHIVALRGVWQDTFRALHPAADGTTYAMKLFGRVVHRRRIDYIFLRQLTPRLRIVSAAHSRTTIPFSDHLAVLTVLSE